MPITVSPYRPVAVSDERSVHRVRSCGGWVCRAAVFIYLALPAFGAAPQSGASVRSLNVTNTEVGIEIEIATDPQVRYSEFDLAGPQRLVLDFLDTVNEIGFTTLPVGTGGVLRIRAGHFDDGRTVATRVVFDLDAEKPYRVTRDEPGIVRVVFPTETRRVSDVPSPSSGVSSRTSRSEAGDSAAAADRLRVQMVEGRVSVFADRVALWRLLAEMDSVVGTESTVRAELAGHEVSIRFEDLPVNLAIRQILEPQPFDYIVVGTRIQITAYSQSIGN